jgi:hypothetical protein
MADPGPPVSALKGIGIAEVWEDVERFRALPRSPGASQGWDADSAASSDLCADHGFGPSLAVRADPRKKQISGHAARGVMWTA